MHVFHIRGISSILLLMAAILAILVVALLLPASFMMVLWNAVVYEAFKGPEIDLYQGFLLWGMILVVLKMVLKPEIQLEFVKASNKNGKSAAKPLAKTTDEAEEAASEPIESQQKES